MSDLKPIKIKGVLYFTKDMSVPPTFFDPENTRFQCTIGNISEAAAAALKEVDIRVKQHEEKGGNYIQSKSKFVFDGFDLEGNKIEATKIGSGTEVEALITPFRHKLSAKHGASPTVKRLIITKLVEYDPKAAVRDESEAL
jgi:hypothetical protein